MKNAWRAGPTAPTGGVWCRPQSTGNSDDCCGRHEERGPRQGRHKDKVFNVALGPVPATAVSHAAIAAITAAAACNSTTSAARRRRARHPLAACSATAARGHTGAATAAEAVYCPPRSTRCSLALPAARTTPHRQGRLARNQPSTHVGNCSQRSACVVHWIKNSLPVARACAPVRNTY
jgi:hypothetical protein